mmetsp:Transcript_47197/g.121982  ORF Transcript_47197/g.121982 Transcript_47197/m.121982 type:complete len:240 (+) Transcript_47197:1195-1914(+)
MDHLGHDLLRHRWLPRPAQLLRHLRVGHAADRLPQEPRRRTFALLRRVPRVVLIQPERLNVNRRGAREVVAPRRPGDMARRLLRRAVVQAESGCCVLARHHVRDQVQTVVVARAVRNLAEHGPRMLRCMFEGVAEHHHRGGHRQDAHEAHNSDGPHVAQRPLHYLRARRGRAIHLQVQADLSCSGSAGLRVDGGVVRRRAAGLNRAVRRAAVRGRGVQTQSETTSLNRHCAGGGGETLD